MLVGSSTSSFDYTKSNKAQESSKPFTLEDEKEVYAQVKEYKSRDEINAQDMDLQKFKDDLTSKGALKFLYDFNMEKIEELVEKYKEELLKEMEENPELEIDIDKMVSEYKKQLLERLAELEKDDKKSVLNVKSIEFEIANKQEVKLEDFLKL